MLNKQSDDYVILSVFLFPTAGPADITKFTPHSYQSVRYSQMLKRCDEFSLPVLSLAYEYTVIYSEC
jgi:hypothetical protein